MKTVTVSASKTYDILIASGLLDGAGGYVRPFIPGGSAAIVTDDIVDRLYGGRLAASLTAAGLQTVRDVIPNGEASKNAETFIGLLNFLAESRLTRADAVVALGGGVVGDLAGFAAAAYMRGVRFIQIPTTLLAAVDSSVGGKTAIDLDAGKNLAGAFYQPEFVLCDLALLDTLRGEIFTDGLAEVIKYGVIADRELFDRLRKPIKPQLEEIVARCVSIKRDIVDADEFETGPRKLLNFGHTVGHAVERLSDYTVSHGRAVAVGMAVMARACAKSGICTDEAAREIVALIEAGGLPVTTDRGAAQLARAALSDKKRSGGTITLTVVERVGKCVLKDMPVEALESFIAPGL